MEDIRTNLFYEQKNGYDLITAQEHALVENYAARTGSSPMSRAWPCCRGRKSTSATAANL